LALCSTCDRIDLESQRVRSERPQSKISKQHAYIYSRRGRAIDQHIRAFPEATRPMPTKSCPRSAC